VAVVETVNGKAVVKAVVCSYCEQEVARYEQGNRLDERAAEYTATVHATDCGPRERREAAVGALYEMGLSLS